MKANVLKLCPKFFIFIFVCIQTYLKLVYREFCWVRSKNQKSSVKCEEYCQLIPNLAKLYRLKYFWCHFQNLQIKSFLTPKMHVFRFVEHISICGAIFTFLLLKWKFMGFFVHFWVGTEVHKGKAGKSEYWAFFARLLQFCMYNIEPNEK